MKERRENYWTVALSEQEGMEPRAQGEGLPQVEAWAGQEGSRAACGVQTGGQADVVVSMDSSLLSASLLNDIYGKQVFC